jgi:hypothetical protein
MPTIKRKINLPAAAQSQAQSGLGIPSQKPINQTAVLAAQYPNSYGFKDATGKVPTTMSGSDMLKAMDDSKNSSANALVMSDLASSPGALPTGYQVPPTGIIDNAGKTYFLAQLTGAFGQSYGQGSSGQIMDPRKFIQTSRQYNYALPSTISRTTFDQPNVEASKSTINQVFGDLLGRQATESEIAKYTNAYLQYAAKNPTSKTTGENNYGYIQSPGTTSQRLFRGSQIETGVANNLTESDFLKNAIQSSGEYSAMNAAGTAFDLLTKLAQQNTGTI